MQDRFFAGDLDPFDGDALAEVVSSLGLDTDHAREVLAGDAYADAVRADTEEGQRLGVTGVPFVVVDRRLAAAGAQSVDGYRQMLDAVTEPVRA